MILFKSFKKLKDKLCRAHLPLAKVMSPLKKFIWLGIGLEVSLGKRLKNVCVCVCVMLNFNRTSVNQSINQSIDHRKVASGH